MQLGPNISGVELAFLSVWQRGFSLNYKLWRTGAIKCKSGRMIFLILTPQVYVNSQRWRTPELLLAQLWREVYTECTLAQQKIRKSCKSGMGVVQVEGQFLLLLPSMDEGRGDSCPSCPS